MFASLFKKKISGKMAAETFVRSVTLKVDKMWPTLIGKLICIDKNNVVKIKDEENAKFILIMAVIAAEFAEVEKIFSEKKGQRLIQASLNYLEEKGFVDDNLKKFIWDYISRIKTMEMGLSSAEDVGNLLYHHWNLKQIEEPVQNKKIKIVKFDSKISMALAGLIISLTGEWKAIKNEFNISD